MYIQIISFCYLLFSVTCFFTVYEHYNMVCFNQEKIKSVFYIEKTSPI